MASLAAFRWLTAVSILAGVALFAAGLLRLLARDYGLAVALLVLGAGLSIATVFVRPAPLPELKPRTLVLYRRAQCPPCDEAKELARRELGGTGIAVEEVDVDAPGNEEARRLHSDWVPVGLYDGRVVFRLQLLPGQLAELLRPAR